MVEGSVGPPDSTKSLCGFTEHLIVPKQIKLWKLKSLCTVGTPIQWPTIGHSWRRMLPLELAIFVESPTSISMVSSPIKIFSPLYRESWRIHEVEYLECLNRPNHGKLKNLYMVELDFMTFYGKCYRLS